MCDQQSLRSAWAYAQSDQSLCSSHEYCMIIKQLTEHRLKFLSLKRGCTGSSESTLVKMPHCWKSRVTAQMYLLNDTKANVIHSIAVLNYYLFSKVGQSSRSCILKVISFLRLETFNEQDVFVKWPEAYAIHSKAKLIYHLFIFKSRSKFKAIYLVSKTYSPQGKHIMNILTFQFHTQNINLKVKIFIMNTTTQLNIHHKVYTCKISKLLVSQLEFKRYAAYLSWCTHPNTHRPKAKCPKSLYLMNKEYSP